MNIESKVQVAVIVHSVCIFVQTASVTPISNVSCVTEGSSIRSVMFIVTGFGASV